MQDTKCKGAMPLYIYSICLRQSYFHLFLLSKNKQAVQQQLLVITIFQISSTIYTSSSGVSENRNHTRLFFFFFYSPTPYSGLALSEPVGVHVKQKGKKSQGSNITSFEDCPGMLDCRIWMSVHEQRNGGKNKKK